MVFSIWIAAVSVFGQKGNGKISRDSYIEKYADLAMQEMQRMKIPASITLAQGCLESDNGNSRLARNGNNHFGIKCHDWDGHRMFHDDDKRNECFRSYKTDADSYRDHSEFLMKERYAGLFELRPDDYRGWARGLKKAGYATARNYADLLIDIIEENELYLYDQMVLTGRTTFPVEESSHASSTTTEARFRRELRTRNGVNYILTRPGDTPESLRHELKLYKNEIYRYNELEKGCQLLPGTVIYLQPKRRTAARGKEVHLVEEGDSMHSISQLYGLKLKCLYKMNLMSPGEEPLPGQEIYLRKPRKEGVLKIEPEPEEQEGPAMHFKFDG